MAKIRRECIGYAIVCFANNGNHIDLPEAYPFISSIFDSRERAIEIAENMRRIGWEKGKDFHFLIEKVVIDAGRYVERDESYDVYVEEVMI